VIDDLTEQVAAASAYYGHDKVVLCANKHNEWISRSIRFSHRQLERMVEERVVQWRQRLAHKALDTASETV